MALFSLPNMSVLNASTLQDYGTRDEQLSRYSKLLPVFGWAIIHEPPINQIDPHIVVD